MKVLKRILIGLAIAGIILATLVMDYKIWKLQHPNAPTWTFFLGKH